LLATNDTRGQHFQFTDWLGTRRAQATAAGVQEEQCQSLPFGDGESCSGSGVDATEHHFMGKERDAESGNDYFGARYYASSMGRFLSPDWSAKVMPVPYAKLDDPQSLNLFAYVRNNPLSGIDSDGHFNGCSNHTENDLCNGSTVFPDERGSEESAAAVVAQTQLLDQELESAQQQMNNGALAGEAANAQGSQHWDVKNQTKIAAGKDKCNEFVGDMIEGVGRARPRVKYTDIRGWLFGMTRDPSAKEWATADIPGYSAPMPVSAASKGDIIAVGHSGDAQGHVGIYVGGSGVASANWYQGGAITINNWGFRPAGQNDEGGGTVVVRKWLGDQ